MKKRFNKFMSDQEAAYIDLLLRDKNTESKKNGLQRLCRYYRNGYRLKNPHPMRQTLIGLLYNRSPKVRRWSLNAIALVGNNENVEAVFDAIERNKDDPDTMSAGIAAVFGLGDRSGVSALLNSRNVPMEGAALVTAAQYSDFHRQELSRRRVSIDSAAPVELRFATLLVGLNQAPSNLFSPNFSNEDIIGELNYHDDALVAQYSVWAICENEKMGLDNFRLPLKNIESFPDNVRGWVYRLLASGDDTAYRHIEYLHLGPQDPSIEAREGLASGIRNTYFDGLEELVCDWFSNDECASVQQRLIEHMAVNAEKCSMYEAYVIEAYRDASANQLAKARLEAATEGQPLYGKLKRLALKLESVSLFDWPERDRGTGQMITQNFNFNNSSVGAVSGAGSAVAGSVSTLTQQNSSEVLNKLLEDLHLLLLGQMHHLPEMENGKQLVESAISEPSKRNIQALVDWMRGVKDIGTCAVDASSSFQRVIENLMDIVKSIPS